MVKMLGKDECRTLPAPERTAKDAVTGKELDLYDSEYEDIDIDARLARAREMSITGKAEDSEGRWKLISEECEYSDGIDDNYLVDSQGFEGRHTETSYSAFTEVTVEDSEGNKYSGYWWEAANRSSELKTTECGKMALNKAVSQIGPKNRRSGRYRMVVDTNAAARLVSPIFTALNAASIQQKMSFMEGKLGERVFPEGFTMMDLARSKGRNGARLYDTEGVATSDAPIIEDGIVKRYFVNTYMANKTGMEPTVEDISRPCIMPFLKGEHLQDGEKAVSLEDILRMSGSGILVTGFNGGNCNGATGDFSFGIEGFAFSRGKITHPVREMLITGNILDLWSNLTTAGTDARRCTRWQIPTLAFDNVSFSA
jgi:PmbA protein